MTIWFTGDHHFNHKNIIKYCKRPFVDVEEMNTVMIERWNEVVKPEDVVYHLGDFSFHKYGVFRRQLNGNIHLILGNHDKHTKKYAVREQFGYITQQYMVKSVEPHIFLSHYKMCVWDQSHHGTWHLYGHSHGQSNEKNNMLSFDVGVDTHNFYPYSYEEIKGKMLRKQEMIKNGHFS